MDGRARTATELALDGGVAPSTASSHIAKLMDAGLIELRRQGRHRYFRIASKEAAAALEGLMGLAASRGLHARPLGPKDTGLHHARVCYDHLAGEAAVHLLDRLRAESHIIGDDDALELSQSGAQWCQDLGIDIEALRSRRRRICRSCLDWSERRTHLAGAIGAALFDRLISQGLAQRTMESRIVELTPEAEVFTQTLQWPL